MSKAKSPIHEPKAPAARSVEPQKEQLDVWKMPDVVLMRLQNLLLQGERDAAMEREAQTTLRAVAMRKQQLEQQIVSVQQQIKDGCEENGQYEIVGGMNLDTGEVQRRRKA